MLNFPLDQCKFKARTWHKVKYKPKDDAEFLEISPDEFIEIRETLCESSKGDAKVYLEEIYKMIIRWCNDDSNITDSESNNSSLDNFTKEQKDTVSNSSLSSFETDSNLSRTKRMDRKQKKRKKKKKKTREGKNSTQEEDSLPRIVEKAAMITSEKKNNKNNNHNHSKERVNDNLINLNDNIVESFTNIDNGVPLDKFHDKLYQSNHQYLPAWNTDKKVQVLMLLYLH